MKIRNKKTGEVGILAISLPEEDTKDEGLVVDKFCGVIDRFSSLAELNEDWEDYEEPKTFWYMTAWGDVKEYSQEQFAIIQKREIGNYFETKEEAEEAVEKLKAYKRLKDKGLRFCAWKITDDGCSVDIETTLDAEIVRAQQKYITDDLNLLFGGEDE